MRHPERETWLVPMTRTDAELLGDLAASAVLGDLRRTSSFAARTSAVELREHWIEYGLQWHNHEYWTEDPVHTSAEAIVHLADQFQEDHDQTDLRCWPVCEVHDIGLHPEVLKETAVWMCRFGGHVVSPIGELGVS